MLEIDQISLRLGGRPILDKVSMRAKDGELCVLMGANGAGKSTLLKAIAGEYAHYEGDVRLHGKNLRQLSIREQARSRAVLSQQIQLQLPFTVAQVVMMGRFVYGREATALDQSIVTYAMELLQIPDLQDRSYLTLSGGQKQRVQMARVLAQILETPDLEGMHYKGKKMLLLDEPVTGMDIRHQQLSLQLAARLARQGVLVIAVLHDFQLAAAYAEKVVLLHRGTVYKQGKSTEVLTEPVIRHCFQVSVQVLAHADYPYPLIVAGLPEKNIHSHNNHTMETTTNNSLAEQWIQFREANPRTRIRDAARRLNATEGQLVAAFTGKGVTALQSDFRNILPRIPALGRVMVLTRNESCVIERKGAFEEVNVENKHVGLVLGKDIDLRMFLNHWVYGFALTDDESNGFKRSIQVFDAQGEAVIKIFAQPETDIAAWDQLVADFSAPEQSTEISVSPAPAPRPNAADIDKTAFLNDWAALQDTHDFFPMLARYRAGRQQALEIAAGKFTRKTADSVIKTMLEEAAATGLEIMVFVGNRGNIEIHTGPVKKIVEIPGWINVMDPDFNLHLRLDDVARCWVVEKPSVDGTVTSIEVFDAQEEMIVQFFGKRKPGSPELQAWRDLVAKF
ncbi:heme ABC transporter ATP-binding protein [Chitinophaga cymbidii]|uniref:ABC transporter domain-containing protein n=1 Tax=Chitinophaga cymbidii TaxID=1096750 RepID=A0A512RSC0_9BACT|nr:heme ABC transporter ATP-binding protein [Chitinophaga cymbidii]GEP98598.1 hypothetical protein CCY01nite_48580 [Chitinophaga cymbidii]